MRAATIALLLIAAMLGGCAGGPASPAASSQAMPPGSFTVHMNGAMTDAVGAARP